MCNCLGLGQGSEKILLSFFSGLLTLSPCQFALGFYPLLFYLPGLFCLRRYSNFKLRVSKSTPLAQTPLGPDSHIYYCKVNVLGHFMSIMWKMELIIPNPSSQIYDICDFNDSFILYIYIVNSILSQIQNKLLEIKA